MEVTQQSGGALGPRAEPLSGGRTKADMSDINNHIWIIEETRFAYRTMVQSVDFIL